MDNSEDVFRAAKRIIEIVNYQNYMKENVQNIKEEDTSSPKIIAFYSTEHHKLSEKIALYVPSSFGESYSIPPVDYLKLEKEYELYGKKVLKKTKELFNEKNIEIETRLIMNDKPEDYIEKAVEEENIDLVVLGYKGEHSKLEQLFSGTIAQKVVNKIHCDVLVVR
ncbi:MAG: universal stress protein [Promethearchaeota archaeon]